MIKNGHNFFDLKDKYTVEQVYLFYEECLKEDLETKKFNAISTANAVSYATPAQDRKGAADKKRHWTQFIDSLDWEKLKSKGRKTAGQLRSHFMNISRLSRGELKVKKKGD